MTAIDMHTEDEQLRGMNVRQAPQPFTGFHMSVDPVENFDGAGGGSGSRTKGACTGSVLCLSLSSFPLLGILGLMSISVECFRKLL